MFSAKKYEVEYGREMSNNGVRWAVINSNNETVAIAYSQEMAMNIAESLNQSGQ